jgi:large subunit ribosomal protein L15
MEKKIMRIKKVRKDTPQREDTLPQARRKKVVVKQQVSLPPAAVVAPSIGLFNLKAPGGAHKAKRILGRGPSSGHGKTSTRGSKGQTSRAGRVTYTGFEGGQTPLIRRIPKRGFTSNFRKEYQILNLKQLSKLKDKLVTPELLEEKGLIKDKARPVKILGDGEIKEAITLRAHAFSKQAQDKLKASGSSYEVIVNA